MPLLQPRRDMIERYTSETLTDFEDGTTTYAASSESVVCDRCGFAFSKSKLTFVDGLELCDSCIDEDKD